MVLDVTSVCTGIADILPASPDTRLVDRWIHWSDLIWFDIHGFVWWKPCKLRVVASVVSQPHLNVFDLQTVRLCQTQRKYLRSDSHVSHSIFGDQCSKWKAMKGSWLPWLLMLHMLLPKGSARILHSHVTGIHSYSLVFTRIHSYSLVFTRIHSYSLVLPSTPCHCLSTPLGGLFHTPLYPFLLALSLLF